MKKTLNITLLIIVILSFGVLGAQTYVGSDACSGCHSGQFGDWADSGHPYKANVIMDNNPPTYPSVASDNNFMADWMTGLGTTWENVSLVIGGFGWKARFVDKEGIIIGSASSIVNPGAGHNQFNFYGGENHGWVDYETGTENKKYNYGCFKCHTTGPTEEGSWLADKGLGNFAEGGVGCEGCHGPGSDHIAGPDQSNIDRNYFNQNNGGNGLDYAGKGNLMTVVPTPGDGDVVSQCGACHNRSFASPINASGGFVKHHEQWDEFVATNHFQNGGQTCVTCHDPHKRTIWDGDGITKTCESCHTTKAAVINHPGTANCVDCHMPYAAKSGAKQGASGFQGDVRSHLVKITVKDESMFTADGSNVRDDTDRSASLGLEYSCLGCHNADPNDAVPDKTLAQALATAGDMHEEQTTVGVEGEVSVPGSFRLYQNSPNPFNPTTSIKFDLHSNQEVHLAIYDVLGQEITILQNSEMVSGAHSISWDGASSNGVKVNSGVYIAKLTTGGKTQAIKMMLLK